MKNIKSLMLTLILGLGVILSTVSCSKQSAWDELENVSLDVYQEGSMVAEIYKLNGDINVQVLKTGQSLDFKRTELKAIIVTGLDNNVTKARFHGHITELEYGKSYTWYINNNDKSEIVSIYSKWSKCIEESDGSDLELEGCDTQFNINW